MAKQFYRITDTWSRVMSPREDGAYMLNDTGQTIQFALSEYGDISRADIKHPLPLGGSICQAYIPPNLYVFAKAVANTIPEIKEPDAEPVYPPEEMKIPVIVVDEEKMDVTTNEDTDIIYRAELDRVINQIMRLEQKVTDARVDLVDNDIEHTLMTREMNDMDRKHDTSEAMLFRYAMEMRFQLLAAENFIRTHKREFAALKATVDGIQLEAIELPDTEVLERQLMEMTSTVTNLVDKVNRMSDQIKDVYVDYEASIAKRTEPIKESVALLSDDFSAFNNALVDMASLYKSSEIEDAYDNLTNKIPTTMHGPVGALKDTLVKLSDAIALNAEQETELETKIDVADTLLVVPKPTVAVLDKIAP